MYFVLIKLLQYHFNMICLRGALLNNFDVPVNTYINTYAFNHLTVTRHTHISYKLAELKYIYTLLLKATSKKIFGQSVAAEAGKIHCLNSTLLLLPSGNRCLSLWTFINTHG